MMKCASAVCNNKIELVDNNKYNLRCNECFTNFNKQIIKLTKENFKLLEQISELKDYYRDYIEKQQETYLEEISNLKNDNYYEFKNQINELKLYIMNKKMVASAKDRKNRVLTKKEKEYIRQKFGNTCSNCNKEYEKKYLHIDHIKPISKGGKNTLDNLQMMCVECNLIKKDYYAKKN
jgi:5-methylcytosine-specific restriction endonuclease McrA